MKIEKEKIIVGPLAYKDIEEVCELDEASGNHVAQWLEDLDDDEEEQDYAWGLFYDDKLVGYCSIGYADDCCDAISQYPGWNYNSLLLSDVFILPKYRRNGLGLHIVNEAVGQRTENEKELAFLVAMYDSLRYFYEQAGFAWITNGIMVRDERNISEEMKAREEEGKRYLLQKLQKLDNLDALNSFLHLKENWNENGSEKISKSLVEFCKSIVKKLDIQPEVFPTAANSIQFEYEKDKVYCEFNIFTDKIEFYQETEDEEIEATRILHSDDFVQEAAGYINQKLTILKNTKDKRGRKE